MPNRALLFAVFLGTSSAPAFAGLPFVCKVNGDSWSIVGSSSRKVACTLRCILKEGLGAQDSVSCSPVVSPGGNDPVCEGFLMGKHWTAATLVAGECATVEP